MLDIPFLNLMENWHILSLFKDLLIKHIRGVFPIANRKRKHVIFAVTVMYFFYLTVKKKEMIVRTLALHLIGYCHTFLPALPSFVPTFAKDFTTLCQAHLPDTPPSLVEANGRVFLCGRVLFIKVLPNHFSCSLMDVFFSSGVRERLFAVCFK